MAGSGIAPELSRPERPKAIVVEDEFLVALHIKDLLAEMGFEVVGHGARLAEAMALAEQQTDLAMAILDVNLAGELSWPVARALRRRGIEFVFVTGYLPAHTALPEDLAGATMLSKPVDLRTLRRALLVKVPQIGLSPS